MKNKIKTITKLQNYLNPVWYALNDVQLQDYLLSHFETVANHNFDVNKTRYEIEQSDKLKSVNMLAILLTIRRLKNCLNNPCHIL